MAVPVRTGAYQPLTIYDAPDVAITQFFDDEASAESFFDTMFRNERLSPLQRDSYQDALRETLGGNPLSDALIGVVTNPWVILGFMFSPAGTTTTGRVFNQFARKSWWNPMAETLNGIFSNTPMAAGGARHQAKGREIIRREFYEAIQPHEEALAAHFKIPVAKLRNPQKINDPALRQEVEDVHNVVYASLDGMDQFREGKGMRALERWNVFAYQPNNKGEMVLQQVSSVSGTNEGQIELRRRIQDYFESQRKRQRPGSSDPVRLPKKLRRELFGRTGAGSPEELVDQFDDVFVARGLPEERHFIPREGRLINPNYEGDSILENLARTKGADLAGLVGAYRNSINQAFKGRFVRLFTKDGTTIQQLEEAVELGDDAIRGLVDPMKLRSHMRAHVKGAHNLNVTQDGGTFIEDLYSLATARGLMTGSEEAARKNLLIAIDNSDEFERLLIDGFVQRVNINNYMPRNGVEFRRPMLDPKTGEVTRIDRAEFLPGEVVSDQAETFLAARRALKDSPTESGRTLSRRRDHAVHEPGDLANLDSSLRRMTGQGLTSTFLDNNADEFQKIMNFAVKDGHLIPTVPINPIRAIRAYENQSARDYVFYVLRPTQEILEAQRVQIPPIIKDMGGKPGDFRRDRAYVPGAQKASLWDVMEASPGSPNAPEGGWVMADVYDQSVGLIGFNAEAQISAGRIPTRSHQSVRNQARKYMDHAYQFGIPSVMGQTRPSANFLMKAGLSMSQIGAAAMEGSFIGRAMPAGMREQLRAFSEAPTESLASIAGYEASGYLYSTHLGLNLGSVMLNLQQPYLHLAGQLGTGVVFRAQMESLNELFNYFGKRYAKHGMSRISPDERAALIRESFDLPEETLLMGDILESVDNVVQSGMTPGRSTTREFITKELPMKLFEKGEWLNRLTTVNAMKRNYQSRGLPVRAADGSVLEGFSVDARRMVQETQFGADPFNTPLAFMTDQSGRQASFLADPLMRMFYTFSFRTPLSLMQIGRRTGIVDPETQRTVRRVRGLDRNLPARFTPFVDLIRLMGISAALYEVGKPFGVDTARGGIAAAMTEIAGGERIFDSPPGMLGVRMPPIISIPMDAMKGVFEGDAQMLSNALLRATVPGSIAISRALGVMPKIDGIPIIDDLQKYYADYDNPNEQGLIPVYKFDGTLVDFRSRTQLIMQGLGVNVGAHKHASNFDHYVNTQRDLIAQMKGQIRNALIMENDFEKASKLEAEFQRKFGFPVAFSKEQMRAGFDAVNAPRTARVLERTPKEFRPFIQRMLAEDSARLGLQPDQIIMGDTIASRRKQGETYERPISPEAMEQMQRLVEARGGTIEEGRRLAFEGFEGY
jgi:hypothetical protein